DYNYLKNNDIVVLIKLFVIFVKPDGHSARFPQLAPFFSPILNKIPLNRGERDGENRRRRTTYHR
ncbi:hypothetical protein, partial [Klebsiella aerogenes]|uniref:hypothetical protein n=1 Tax=Klebsiella aerogenes TaxID=548 RepID=UPI001CFC12C3